VRVVVASLLERLGPPSDLHLSAKAFLATQPDAAAASAQPLRRKTSRSSSEAAASKA
jgi:hypothetical protein